MSVLEVNAPPNRHERRALEAGREPLAVPMVKVPDWLGISRSKAYEEIAAGRLKAVKCGSNSRPVCLWRGMAEWPPRDGRVTHAPK
jgi:hypothetical protein